MDDGRQHPQGIVFIASEPVLAAWSARPTSLGEVVGLTDTDTQRAFAIVAGRRPRMVVLEQLFAATRRGAAFIHRVQTDPAFHGVEIRLLSPERVAQIPHLGVGVSLAALAYPIQSPSRPVRRAGRVKISREIEAMMDGNSTSLVDLSTRGAQVLLSVIVRPDQRVRLQLAGSILIQAKVVWAAPSRPAAPFHYRAGIEFVNVNSRDVAQVFWHLGLQVNQ